MDVYTYAWLFVMFWIGIFCVVGAGLGLMVLAGFGKWIWNLIASSTEEAVVEGKTLRILEEKK